jgi:hypothetical protein
MQGAPQGGSTKENGERKVELNKKKGMEPKEKLQ